MLTSGELAWGQSMLNLTAPPYPPPHGSLLEEIGWTPHHTNLRTDLPTEDGKQLKELFVTHII